MHPARVLGPLVLTWINNYHHYKMWDEIIYPFPNANGATVGVWEWINNFNPHFSAGVVTYPNWVTLNHMVLYPSCYSYTLWLQHCHQDSPLIPSIVVKQLWRIWVNRYDSNRTTSLYDRDQGIYNKTAWTFIAYILYVGIHSCLPGHCMEYSLEGWSRSWCFGSRV